MTNERRPNLKLAQAMRAAGFSNKSLARAVIEASRRQGRTVSTDHSRVADWLNGRQPRQDAINALVAAFDERSGRTYRPSELGLLDSRPLPADLGLAYEKNLNLALHVVADLAQHDLDDHPDIRSNAFSVGGLATLCLDWLLGQDADELPSRQQPGILSAHVEELRLMREQIDVLDRRFGGEHHRRNAVRYLRDAVAPKLSELNDDVVSREFLREAAILCELIGWMSYDTGQQSAAQRYFAKAVRLAQASGDEGYAAFAVTSMADQALYVGHPEDALRLAIVAQRRTARALPTVALLEARSFRLAPTLSSGIALQPNLHWLLHSTCSSGWAQTFRLGRLTGLPSSS